MKTKRCFICKNIVPTRPVLMVGPAGFRRYELCAKCEAEKAFIQIHSKPLRTETK
jgi:hypothetical protein